MSQRYFIFLIMLLLLSALACEALSGAETTPLPPTAVATPTLAASATPDPNATPTSAPTNQDQESVLVTPLPDETLVRPKGFDDTPTPIGGGSGGASGGGSGDGSGGGSSSGGDSGNGGDSGSATNGGSGANSGGGGTSAACPAPGTNLLANPSFEGAYKPFGAITELNHAPSWFPWWRDGENNLRPEYKPAGIDVAPNRVHSGSTAQQYFKSFGQFKAGLSQGVLNLSPGTRLQFSAHGQAWSCSDFSQCSNGTSFEPANSLMRVGIDPFGGTDPFSGDIVWSPYFNPLDRWEVACVEVVSESSTVTVYVWASPDGPRQNQDIYWDDASLVILP